MTISVCNHGYLLAKCQILQGEHCPASKKSNQRDEQWFEYRIHAVNVTGGLRELSSVSISTEYLGRTAYSGDREHLFRLNVNTCPSNASASDLFTASVHLQSTVPALFTSTDRKPPFIPPCPRIIDACFRLDDQCLTPTSGSAWPSRSSTVSSARIEFKWPSSTQRPKAVYL